MTIFMKLLNNFTLVLILVIALVPGYLIAQETSPPTHQQAISKSRQMIEKAMRDHPFPGMAVAVSIKGELIWSAGFGVSDMKKATKVDPAKSKFRIGSVSKPITAVGLAKLYEEGKADLDAPIQTYVPDFPQKKYAISLRQLAGHLAGIRHYRGLEFMNRLKYETVADGLDIFKADTLLFEPGTKYAYSSYGWNLISAAMEGAADTDFLSYIDQTVFRPLKMRNTCADHADQNIPGRVKFYVLSKDKIVEAAYVDNSYKWAGGGFLSTAEDLIRFGNAQLYAKLLKPETIELFRTPQQTTDGKSTNYGMGWTTGEDKKGRAWFGHSGGSVGGTTFLIIYPETEMVFAGMVNLSSAPLGDLMFRVANQFFQTP